jgi:hypothetical protein
MSGYYYTENARNYISLKRRWGCGNQTERQMRFLKAYCAVATLACAVFLLTAFSAQSRRQKFEEIDVERINIVEKNGKLDMVISNQERQHPGIFNGKIIERKSPRPPGIIFFNHLGDEMGGLISVITAATGISARSLSTKLETTRRWASGIWKATTGHINPA